MSYIDVSGKTVEEALAKALAQLQMDRDDVSVRVLERAKSGFLGLGASPAVIRVTYGEEMEEAVTEPVRPEPIAEPVRPEPIAEPKPAAPKAERPQRSERPARSEKPRAPKPEKPKAEPKPEVEAEDKPAEVSASLTPAPLGEEVDDAKAQDIKKFLTGLLQQMEVEAQVRVYQPEKGRYKVILEGKSLGALIGRRGETLDAIQQLTSYAVNRGGDRRCRVQLDAENYRERREQSLCRLAEKMAEKAVRYRRNVTMEPMNAYERHVIHTALQDTPHVTTYSTGVDPNRRVIISYDRNKV